jgi:hypothetical protein
MWADTLDSMNAALVEGKITGLDTFAAWQTAGSEQQHAFNAVPFEINQNNPEQLRQQLGYIATEEEQHAARQTLMQEIASQDDGFLPVTYRLGALAAFEATDRPLNTKYHAKGSVSRGSDLFRIDRHEQQIRPSSSPVKLAIQIGDELERLRGLLDTRRSVPVVMVWKHDFIPPRIDYDEVVMGELPNPREAFQLEAPKVSEVDGEQVIDYTIPSRLSGVKKGRIVNVDEYVQPEDKYKNPVITTLVRLGVARSSFMSHDPDALYIGSKDVKERVKKAEQDKASYARQLEARRRIPAYLRRY